MSLNLALPTIVSMKSDEAFAVGFSVRYKEQYGTIRFICEEYITICIREHEDKVRNLCLIVYPQDYSKVHLLKESEK